MNDYKIFVAGHNGMVGSAIARELTKSGVSSSDIICKTKGELDLTNQKDVLDFFLTQKPEQVYLAAAKVGGIHANDVFQAEFIYQNISIQSNIIHSAYLAGVKQLLFLGSSCIYPKMSHQPIHESSLMAGKLESTNEAYAIAKISGIQMCHSYNTQYGTDFRCIMPSNLYGPGDNYHPENSHVIPALIRRFHEAKLANFPVTAVWGSGTPRREFLYVNDLAEACIYTLNLPAEKFYPYTVGAGCHINAGYGKDLTIQDLAYKIKEVVGFDGEIRFDKSKPDGTPAKLLDSGVINKLGWAPSTDLTTGLKTTYDYFVKHNYDK